MNWIKGPLGYSTSEDWRYWVPKRSGGLYRAWFYPDGLPGKNDELLGDLLETEEEAKRLCEEHQKRNLRYSA